MVIAALVLAILGVGLGAWSLWIHFVLYQFLKALVTALPELGLK